MVCTVVGVHNAAESKKCSRCCHLDDLQLACDDPFGFPRFILRHTGVTAVPVQGQNNHGQSALAIDNHI